MLSKRNLLRFCSRQLVSSFKPIQNPMLLAHQKTAKFCSFPFDPEVKGSIQTQDEPKWMRFFKGMEPNPVDLERAVKSDNVELLNNYVKLNYLGFDFTQLVAVLGGLSKMWATSTRVFAEIKIRVTSGKYESNQKIIYQLFSGAREFILADEFMKKFMVLELDKYFENYGHKEQSEIILFWFDAQYIKRSKADTFLLFYKQFTDAGKAEEYCNSLSLTELLNEIKTLDAFKQNLQIESFSKVFSSEFIEALANKLLSVITISDIQQSSKEIEAQLIFEASLPQKLHLLFSAEHIAKIKIQLALNLYTRFNVEENLGKYLASRQEKNTVKILKDNFHSGDRYLLEAPLSKLLHYMRQRFYSGERYDYTLNAQLQKFAVVDPSFLETLMEDFKVSLRFNAKKSRMEKTLVRYTWSRWRELTELNFDEVFKGLEHVEKQSISVIKIEIIKIFERYINESHHLNELLSQLYQLITQPPQAEIENQEEMPSVGELDGDSLYNALKSEIGEKDNIDDSLFVNQSSSNEPNLQQLVADSLPTLNKKLIEQLRSDEFTTLNFCDKQLEQMEMEFIGDYLSFVEAIARMLLFGRSYEINIADIKKFFAKKEQKTIIEAFMYFPNFLENLILIDSLSKDIAMKSENPDEEVFSNAIRMRIYQEKRKIDDLFSSYHGKTAKLLKSIETRFQKKIETTNEVELCSAIESQNIFARYPQVNFAVNFNKARYQDEIKALRESEAGVNFKYSNVPHVSEKYTITEENFYIKCLNTDAFHRQIRSSHLKKIVGDTLKKMNIPFIQNYCDFPFVADFLLYPKTDQKIILQVTDPDKLLLGVENVRTVDDRIDEYGFAKHGYNIIHFRPQDFDIEEEAMIEKIQAAINSST